MTLNDELQDRLADMASTANKMCNHAERMHRCMKQRLLDVRFGKDIMTEETWTDIEEIYVIIGSEWLAIGECMQQVVDLTKEA